MRSLLATLILLASTSSMAGEKLVIECSPPADTLDFVQVIENQDGSAKLEIHYLSEEYDTLKVKNSLEDLKKGQAATVVAILEKGPSSYAEMAILQIAEGQKQATLTFRGGHFAMNCRK